MQDFFTHDEMQDFSHEQLANLRRYWLRNYADNFKLLEEGFKGISALPDYGYGKPVAVIGGAPISPETFELLDEMDIITVCCDKALPRILPYYRPDYVTALNTQKTDAVELEDWFADSKDMSLIVPVTVHPKTIELWNGDVYWMNPTNTHEDIQMRIEQETGLQPTHRGMNVGEFSLLMAAFMRPAELGLFGLWYAWRSKSEVLKRPLPESYSLVKLVDNGDVWYTDVTWLSSRATFLEFCKSVTLQGTEIHNCSLGGILYHTEYCKETTPEEFAERWQDDLRTKDKESESGEEERGEDGTDTDTSTRKTKSRDDILPLSKMRIRDAPDEHYGGD